MRINGIKGIMCTIFIAWKYHNNYDLICASNRDEFFERETRQAEYWEDNLSILGGRDLVAGGTWLGITKNGRFATITNYREMSLIKERFRSRGNITKAFLKGTMSPIEYCAEVEIYSNEYNPFNLLVGDKDQLVYFSSVTNVITLLKPGVYSLSNAMLDTPWAKVVHGKREFIKCISVEDVSTDCLYRILRDDTKFTNNLPDTGFGDEMEKNLSSIFISLGNYGTRASTIILVDKSGGTQFTERSFKANEKKYIESNYLLNTRS